MTLTTSEGLQVTEQEPHEVHAVYVSLCQALSMAASVNVCKETILVLLSSINAIIKSTLPEYQCILYVISVNVNGREKSTITNMGLELIACPQERLIRVANRPHLKRHVTLCLIEERGTVQSYSMLDALSRGTTRYFMTNCCGVIALGALSMERCNAVVLQLKGKHPRPIDGSTLALAYDLSTIMARGTHSSKPRHQATARSQSGYGDDTFDDGVNGRDEMTTAYFEYEKEMKRTFKWSLDKETLDITAPRQRLGKAQRAAGVKKPTKKCNKLPVTTPQIVSAFVAEQYRNFSEQRASIADELTQSSDVNAECEERPASQDRFINEALLALESESLDFLEP